MKYLSKVLLVLVFISFAAQSHAQVKFGVKGGLNPVNVGLDYEEKDLEPPTIMRLAYHIGATVDYSLSDALSVRFGLLLSSKGFSSDLEEIIGDAHEEEINVEGYARVSFNYLEVPINMAYKINNIQVYAGPYFAIGTGGKSKSDYTIKFDGNEVSYSNDSKVNAVFGDIGEGDIGNDEGAYNALDAGMNLGVGYLIGPMLISAGYSWGFANLNPKYENSELDPKDYRITNRVITLSLSYFFGE